MTDVLVVSEFSLISIAAVAEVEVKLFIGVGMAVGTSGTDSGFTRAEVLVETEVAESTIVAATVVNGTSPVLIEFSDQIREIPDRSFILGGNPPTVSVSCWGQTGTEKR